LHGGGGSGDQFARASGLGELAEARGFAVVFADGVALKPVNLKTELRTWNAGRCCGPAVREAVDDVGYLAALIDQVRAQIGVLDLRIAVVGHSNGAMMAWRIACERPDLVDAAAAVAGSLEVADLDSCAAEPGVSLLVIHGTADRNHPLEGGKGSGVAGVAFRSVAESVGAWGRAHDCAGGAGGEPIVNHEGPLTTTSWSGCTDQTVIEQIIVDGAEHPWPGANGEAVSALSGVPSQDLDASSTVWDFVRSVD
jgi:polyhydroxybutyrate depolymerase